MESKDKVQFAVKKQMKNKMLTIQMSDEDESLVPVDDDNRVNLISQLERLEADDKLEKTEVSADKEESSSSSATVGTTKPKSETPNVVDGSGSSGMEREEIVKELKKLKRQNFITHCLLSVMIVLTVAWQLSEVSLILKVKDRMSHPFRSFSNLFSGMLKPPNDGEEEVKQSTNQTLVESSSLPGLKIPEIPRIEIPDLDFNGNHE